MSITWVESMYGSKLMYQDKELGYVECEKNGWVWVRLDRNPVDSKVYPKSSRVYFLTIVEAQKALLDEIRKYGFLPDDYFTNTPGWTDAHVREVRARRYELAAVLIRRGEDELPIVETSPPWCGIVWRTRLQALDRMVNLQNEVDFRRSVAMAGFNPDDEVVLVVARAKGKQS